MDVATQSIDALILARVIDPQRPHVTADAARALLGLRFNDGDIQRMNSLAEKARLGTLTGDEQLELEAFERIGSLIGFLHSKARQTLTKSGTTP